MKEIQANSRQYHSPLRDQRAAETRQAILSAARRLFRDHGYAATSIAQIAREAEISPQTIYNSIGGKPAVLLALNDVIDEIGQVREIQQQIGQSADPREIVRLVVRLRRLLMEGAGDIVNLVMNSSLMEPEVARVYEDGMQRSRTGISRVIEKLTSLDALAPGLDPQTATDIMFALLHPSMWNRLVDDAGWDAEAFEAFSVQLLSRMLLKDERPAQTG